MPELLKSHDRMANSIASALVRFKRSKPGDSFFVMLNTQNTFGCFRVNSSHAEYRAKNPMEADVSDPGYVGNFTSYQKNHPVDFIGDCEITWNNYCNRRHEWPLTDDYIMHRYLELLATKGTKYGLLRGWLIGG